MKRVKGRVNRDLARPLSRLESQEGVEGLYPNGRFKNHGHKKRTGSLEHIAATDSTLIIRGWAGDGHQDYHVRCLPNYHERIKEYLQRTYR